MSFIKYFSFSEISPIAGISDIFDGDERVTNAIVKFYKAYDYRRILSVCNLYLRKFGLSNMIDVDGYSMEVSDNIKDYLLEQAYKKAQELVSSLVGSEEEKQRRKADILQDIVSLFETWSKPGMVKSIVYKYNVRYGHVLAKKMKTASAYMVLEDQSYDEALETMYYKYGDIEEEVEPKEENDILLKYKELRELCDGKISLYGSCDYNLTLLHDEKANEMERKMNSEEIIQYYYDAYKELFAQHKNNRCLAVLLSVIVEYLNRILTIQVFYKSKIFVDSKRAKVKKFEIFSSIPKVFMVDYKHKRLKINNMKQDIMYLLEKMQSLYGNVLGYDFIVQFLSNAVENDLFLVFDSDTFYSFMLAKLIAATPKGYNITEFVDFASLRMMNFYKNALSRFLKSLDYKDFRRIVLFRFYFMSIDIQRETGYSHMHYYDATDMAWHLIFKNNIYTIARDFVAKKNQELGIPKKQGKKIA